LSHTPSTVRDLELLVALSPVVIWHGVLTCCANFLAPDDGASLTARNSGSATLVVLVDHVTRLALLAVTVRMIGPGSAVGVCNLTIAISIACVVSDSTDALEASTSGVAPSAVLVPACISGGTCSLGFDVGDQTSSHDECDHD
jgi:hypothetical protein